MYFRCLLLYRTSETRDVYTLPYCCMLLRSPAWGCQAYPQPLLSKYRGIGWHGFSARWGFLFFGFRMFNIRIIRRCNSRTNTTRLRLPPPKCQKRVPSLSRAVRVRVRRVIVLGLERVVEKETVFVTLSKLQNSMLYCSTQHQACFDTNTHEQTSYTYEPCLSHAQ